MVIPPAYGLQDIHSITFTGDGSEIAYWNRYVAVTQMGGQGSFSDPRLGLDITNGTQDLVSSKLPALQAYQLSLAAPPAPAGSFDATAAARGKTVFEGAGRCASCHSGALFTDANSTLHPPSDSMAEPETPSYATRSATKQYRTSPLRGVWQHAPLLPRRLGSDAGGRCAGLQPQTGARLERSGCRRPGPVSEVTVDRRRLALLPPSRVRKRFSSRFIWSASLPRRRSTMRGEWSLPLNALSRGSSPPTPARPYHGRPPASRPSTSNWIGCSRHPQPLKWPPEAACLQIESRLRRMKRRV